VSSFPTFPVSKICREPPPMVGALVELGSNRSRVAEVGFPENFASFPFLIVVDVPVMSSSGSSTASAAPPKSNVVTSMAVIARMWASLTRYRRV
jgi:hypothetical protein